MRATLCAEGAAQEGCNLCSRGYRTIALCIVGAPAYESEPPSHHAPQELLKEDGAAVDDTHRMLKQLPGVPTARTIGC